MLKKILTILRKRPLRLALFLIADVVALSASAVAAFFLRFEGPPPLQFQTQALVLIPLNVLFVIPALRWQRMYSINLSFVSIRDLYRLVKAVVIGNLGILLVIFILRDIHRINAFPRSALLMNAALSLLSLSALRIAKRMGREFRRNESGRKILIVGADSAAEQIARHILGERQWNLVGFVDDSVGKQNSTIHGVPVLGYRKNLSVIAEKYGVEEVVIALQDADANLVRETVERARAAHIKSIKIVPSFTEIIHGNVALTNIRDVALEDLLVRKPVRIDTLLMKQFLQGKKILVTGAAGSIGSRLCQEILAFHPHTLIGVDQNETGVFHLERHLKTIASPATNLHVLIADVCDVVRMHACFERFHPDIVFHAAAYKHVPLMEGNPHEAVKNNIFGTLSVAQSALKHGIEKFIFVSTDKAVNPNSVMGATKCVGEKICRALNVYGKTQFCAVRFGNVLDSQGNVIKVFEEQIRKGGPVEITHPDMRRYFMLTSEACLLVMQAGTLSKGGEVFMLDMGAPINILDMAREMIRLGGHKPDVDIPITFTGIRPGEKLFEELVMENETPTRHEKIFIVQQQESPNIEFITHELSELKNVLHSLDERTLRAQLRTLVPSYREQQVQ